jgi:hypothetical protein
LALVAVARVWGFSARAFQGERGNLIDVPLPAVVHLRSALESDGSFGVPVGVEADKSQKRADATTRELILSTWVSITLVKYGRYP